jgi:pimeloyl-ACP methyl ester carboxylesterase
MLHGNLSSSYCFESFFPQLSKSFTIIAPDLRGFGYSSYNKSIKFLDDFAEDLKLLVDSLGVSKFHLFGWSVGGGIAMKFAAQYPKYVEKLIVQNSVGIKGFNIGTKQNFHIKPEDILKTSMIAGHGKVSPKIRDGIKEKFLSVFSTNQKKMSLERTEAFIDQILMQRHLPAIMVALAFFNISDEHNGIIDGSGEAKMIKCKTLILGGDKDSFCDYNEIKGLKKALGKLAEVKIFEKCGHSVLEEYSQEVVELICEFA